MKKILLAITACFCWHSALLGQGTILLDNGIPGVVDGRFLITPQGPGVGVGWTAQLLVGGGSLNLPLIRLVPTTTFKTSSEAETGYVNPIVVTVPGAPAGTSVFATIVAFREDNPSAHGTSIAVPVTLGGNGAPPAILSGLSRTIVEVPEPSTYALGVIGTIAMTLLARRRIR